jgi:hypothetical protein
MRRKNMSIKEFNFSGFSRVSVKFAMDVEIVRADSYSVIVSGSDSLIDNLEVKQEGDKLVIGYNVNLKSIIMAPFSHATARITLPDLRELTVTGAAKGVVRGFNSPNDFALIVSGASKLDMYEMSVGNMTWELSGASKISGQVKAAGNVDLDITGASKIDLKGTAQDIKVRATGASQIDLEEFPVRNANIKMTGASRSTVNLNGKLDVALEGASSLEYQGQLTMGDVKITGASTFKKK